MQPKEILRENGEVKAKIQINDFVTILLTTRKGYQWTTQPITPELARLTIEVLQEYLKEEDNG